MSEEQTEQTEKTEAELGLERAKLAEEQTLRLHQKGGLALTCPRCGGMGTNVHGGGDALIHVHHLSGNTVILQALCMVCIKCGFISMHASSIVNAGKS